MSLIRRIVAGPRGAAHGSGAKYSLHSFPLRPVLPLPDGVGREELFEWLKTVRVENAPDSIVEYCNQDFERFVHTFGLVQRSIGKASDTVEGLELGANPYFTTTLLRQFTRATWHLANYFDPSVPNGAASERVFHGELGRHGATVSSELTYSHFNIEKDPFPFASESLDIVLFCEIIEHLLNDPCRVLREIRRVLRNGGTLVLTTPNVCRLENVARMIAGVNIYDPYSGHGPYGRHNREYSKHELFLLLDYLGFTIEEMFTADVDENRTESYLDPDKFGHLIEYRKHDLGHYIFLRATKTGEAHAKKPAWLYRSYHPSQLE
jgi:SAM-dependent methyltransferase